MRFIAYIFLFSFCGITSASDISHLKTQFDEIAGKSGYDYAVLEKDGKHTFILGESHYKDVVEKLQGSRIVAQFSLFGLEGVPSEEVAKTSEFQAIHLIASFIYDYPGLSYLLFGYLDSTIEDAWATCTKEIKTVSDKTSYEANILSALDSLQSKNERVCIFLEGGQSLSPDLTRRYIIDSRDYRMANNIAFIIQHLECTDKPMLVVAGRGHVSGLVSLLTKEHGFHEEVYSTPHSIVEPDLSQAISWLATISLKLNAYLIVRYFTSGSFLTKTATSFIIFRVLDETINALQYPIREYLYR